MDDWLRERHRRMRTPREVVDEYVLRATGSSPLRLERIVAGQVNEVYDVLTVSGESVVVRLGHGDDPRFHGEAWAFDRAREVGVPTPRVLYVTETCSVLEKLPGVGLDVAFAGGEVPQRVVDELADLLARIHSVPVDGLGYLQADGRGWPITFASIMADLVEHREKLVETARHWGFAEDTVHRGLGLLEANVHRYDWDTPRLLHGDFGGNNLLVDGDQVTGVLDMQECAGGHPVFDLVGWPRLLDAYPGETGDEYLRQLVSLRQGLWMLMVRADRHEPEPGPYLRQVDEAMAFFTA